MGFSLGRYFIENGVEVTGYVSHSTQSAKEAALFTNSKAYDNMENIVRDSDILFLTVPDGVIEEVWNNIKGFSITGKRICHCSGLLSSSVFTGIDENEAYAYSIHPIFAINDKITSYRELHKALFTIEGSSADIELMKQFIQRLGNKTQIIDAAYKTKYHAAAVMVSNHVVAITQIGIDLLINCGFSEENAKTALGPLMLGNMMNIVNRGSMEALTGPVERNDVITITKHLECLSGREHEIYTVLSEVLVDIAKNKHPEKDFSELKKELAK